MLRVVTWLWKPHPAYRSQFAPEHTNILRRMVARNYPHPHEMVCITDQTEGFDPEIRLIPLWQDYRGLGSPYGPGAPSCYPRLRAFSPEMADVIGPRFVSMDLDVIITGDLTSIWNREEDFLIWGGKNRRTPWNGSMWMMTAGAREKVWTEFQRDPERAKRKALGAGFYGSDQAWMNYILGPNENHWDEDDGVYSYRMHVKNNNGLLPPDARIVFTEGHYMPSDPNLQKLPWVQEHYR